MFVEARQSSKLLHVYNPEKPQAVGIFDKQCFQEQRVLQSASHVIINASKARQFVLLCAKEADQLQVDCHFWEQESRQVCNLEVDINIILSVINEDAPNLESKSNICSNS